MTTVNINQQQYYLNHLYKERILDKILPNYIRKGWDMVIIVEGKVGAGKTTIAIQSGYYLDPTLTVDRICFTLSQFEEAVDKGKKGQVIIYDEAVTSMLSIEAFKFETAALIKKITQCRKKGLIIFLLIPSIFMLQKYFAIYRSHFDIRVLATQGERGKFVFYNEKAKQDLIVYSRGTYKYNTKPSFPIMNFTKYCPISIDDGSDYDKKKDAAMITKEDKKSDVLPAVLWAIHKEFKLGRDKMDKLFKKYNVPLKGQAAQDRWILWNQKQS
jgi:hypothetical protein